MSSLVIVESPAKCAKIKSILGPGYNVIASMGHIRALVPKYESIGIANDWQPKYDWIATKAKAITHIKEEAKRASHIYLAGDSDREGEMISYSVCLLLKLDPATTPRIVFTEITDKAIKAAVANPRTLDMNKVNAQQARSLLDMLVGFTISPLLWKSVGPALSAGRCQTPALRLVVDREQTIKNFSSTLSWVIAGTFKVSHNKSSKITFQASMDDELEDEESAQNYLSNHSDETIADILTNTVKPTTSQPPNPLITSTLQQQASTLYRAGPAQTMRAAQKLYEAGHITYMRTDHAVLSEDAVKEAKDYIIETWGEEYIGIGDSASDSASAAEDMKKKTKKIAKKKEDEADAGPKAQEAHEAIRPTHIHQVKLPGEEWSSLERNVYNLIWLRTVQSVMAPSKGEICTVRFAFDGEAHEWIWRTIYSRTTFPGWKATTTKETTVEEDDDNAADAAQQQDCTPESWAYATQTLKPSTPLTYTTLTAAAHVTKPVSRYNEASLIKDLETKGIGRPSTYASLMETIQEKLYVEKRDTPARSVNHNTYSVRPGQSVAVAVEERKVGGEKDRLYPTALGLSVLEYCVKHFDDLFDYGFTAQMEARLDAVAQGTEPWKQVLKDTWASYKDRYEDLNKETGSAKRREFAGGIVAVSTAKGPLLLKEEEKGAKEPAKTKTGGKKTSTPTKEESKATFYGWPQGKTLQSITQADVDAFLAQKTAETTETTIGTHNDTPIVRKKGPYGLYCEWGSIRVPYKEDSTLESIIEDLEKKEGSTLRTVGDIIIKNGPYGIYMYKKGKPSASGKSFKPTFVTVPKDADWKTATEAELSAMYSAGVDQKKAAWKAKKGYSGPKAK
jgi:DNA topoisomerase-1